MADGRERGRTSGNCSGKAGSIREDLAEFLLVSGTDNVRVSEARGFTG